MNSEEKLSFLWKLSRCEETPVIGTHTCNLCGITQSFKNYKCIGTYIPSSLLHLIEYHNHLPTPYELSIVNAAYADRIKTCKTYEKKYQMIKLTMSKL